MPAVVVDCSALVFATTATAGATLRRRLAADDCHAPHLIDAELGSVLRRWVLRGQMSPAHAHSVLTHAGDLIEHRYAQRGALGEAAWTLRERVGFYDGLYVALAASLGAPLVTLDRRLAGAGSLPCGVELYG